MGNNDIIVWAGAAAAAAALIFVFARLRAARARRASAPELERSPVPVEGTTAMTGLHKGVKYWIYLENSEARLEIEAGAARPAPFRSDGRKGKAQLPGDARDHDVRELLRLGAVCVEAAADTGLIAAYFPERALNLNAGTRYAARPDEDNANKAVEFLAAIRDRAA